MVNTEEVIGELKKQGRTVLTEIESKQLLQRAGINSVETRLASSAVEAVTMAGEIGFLGVLKIASPDITHKSDAGGVKIGITNKKSVRAAYKEIIKTARERYSTAKIQGVSVQNMARKGTEIIVGTFKDSQFDPVAMFGLGGIFVEIFKDVSFRILPLTRRDAAEMIREVKGYPLLQGYRGEEPVGISFLEDLLLDVSDIIQKMPEIEEMDLNPVFAYKDGVLVVDARIVIAD